MAIPDTYRAYQYENYGPLENELKLHVGVPQAVLGPQEVRIKVRSAAVNPIDYMLLEVLGQAFLGESPSAEKPFSIGFDASGEVAQVGKAVKRLKVGDAVYTMTPFGASGSLAEFLVVDEAFVASKPSNLDFNEAAAVPSVALTAYAGMARHAKLRKGETVLILGGSSSVGMFAVQFARAMGARVVTTTSSRNVELVKSLGADQVIDYTKEKWLDVLEPHSVDALYDCGMEPSAWNDGAQVVLKKNTGRFITILPMTQPVKASEFEAQLIGEVHNTDPSAEKLAVVTELIESGKAKPVIDTVYPFEKALDAYKKLKTRHARGKLIVQVQP
jgi:NADPH:quinone reductase-like Zn-dependent oxidoreductase